MLFVSHRTDFCMQRCAWVPLDKADYVQYHDLEWGVPVHDDRQLFEMLILEGSQAGLNWYTILKKRAAYRQAFHHFDPEAWPGCPTQSWKRFYTTRKLSAIA